MFITSHEDKVYQSYEYHPFWFVRKSHMYDLNIVIPKLLRKIDIEEEKNRCTFNLKTENCTVEIDINTVIYIESFKNDIIIHDRALGEKQIRCKMIETEKQLYPMNIIRIQNGILVNCRYISKITSREVILTDGTRLGLKNQLLTIMQYAEAGKIADIKAYVNVLTNEYLPNILNYINTNNAAFDAVINSKIAVCNQNNIFMEVNIKQDTDINIPPTEIAVLFGNLLDNSIEAAKYTDEKRISLDIQKNASYLILLVSNSIKSSVLKTNENLETSKSDKELHGIGIKSIENIVQKHNGMIQFYEEENEFCCHIMIETE